MEYKYYIFDFDNTLCDSSAASKLTYQRVFNHFDIVLNSNNIDIYLSESLEETYRSLGKVKATLKEFVEYYFNISDEIIVNRAAIYPEVFMLLNTIHVLGKKAAIVTSKNRSTIMCILRKFEIEDQFSSIICYEDVENHKPHPEGILLCLDKLRVTCPEQAVYIGDSINDMKAARASGVNFIGVRGIFTRIEGVTLASLREIRMQLLMNH